METIEIELRFSITDTVQLNAALAPLVCIDTKRVVDVYYDTHEADLVARGIYLRVRDDKKMDIKFNRECLHNPNLELQPYCEEHTFMLPICETDRERLNNVMRDLNLVELDELEYADFAVCVRDNNLIPHRVVDKIRTTYKHGKFTIVVDHVKELGAFLEIEIMAKDISQLAAVQSEMAAFIAGLPLKPLTTGYDSLMLRKNNFEQYLKKSRFILEEDKALRNAQM